MRSIKTPKSLSNTTIMAGRDKPRHASNIYDRAIARNKLEIPTVSLSAQSLLTSEILQYSLDNASSTSDLDER